MRYVMPFQWYFGGLLVVEYSGWQAANSSGLGQNMSAVLSQEILEVYIYFSLYALKSTGTKHGTLVN